MSFEFQPAISNGTTTVALPGPIRKLQIQEGWDYERYKVLLNTGDETVGTTRDGVDITIEADVARYEGSDLLSEHDMLTAIEDLRTVLAGGGDEGLSLILFQDAVTGEKKLFERCTVTRFRSDLSQPELYQYLLLIHAGEPMLQTI